MGRSADMPRVRGRSGSDDAGCGILHVDMDAFFASVEINRRPELRGRPVLVGGTTRGVVAAASYEARRYGIRSAMSMAQARRLCPQAVVLPPDRAAYTAASAQVMQILSSFTPLIEPLSLDEAFLDISGSVRLFGRPTEIAERIRHDVQTALGLTCSVGVASTKFVAKLASARCKPDGLLVIAHREVLAFLHPLPVTVLWGVGQRTAEPLHRLGIRTVGDLAATPIETLRRSVGVSVADHLAALAAGQDPRSVSRPEAEKSISSDRTLDTDVTEESDVNAELLRLAAEVTHRLRKRGLVARTIGIKIRFADFTTVTRVRTLTTWINSTNLVHLTALELYRGLNLDRPRIRLVGVKAEGLLAAGQPTEQPMLDESGSGSRLDQVADDLKARYGNTAVSYGTLLPKPARRLGTVTRNARQDALEGG